MASKSFMFMFNEIPRRRCILQKIKLLINPGRNVKYHINYNNLSTVCRADGYSSYEEERASNKVIVPEKFNFASDVLDKWAQKEEEGTRTTSIPAFWFVSDDEKEIKFSFKDLQNHSKRLANILQEQCNLKRDDNVIIMLPKCPDFWLVNIAALRIGSILSPVSMMLKAKDLAYRINSLKPTSIIAHESVADVVDEATTLSNTVKNKIIVAENQTRRTGWYDLHRLKTTTNDQQCAVTKSDETMMIFFTSGTTGNPKMVEHTHASFGIGLHSLGKYTLDLTSNNIIWNMSDTGWGKSHYSSFFGPWSQGACVFIHQMSRYNPIKTLEVLTKYPIDTLCAPPLVFRSLVQEDLKSYKFNKLEHCVSGGETLNEEVMRKWSTNTGLKIHNIYGQTENAGVTSMRKSFEFKIGSIGKPMPGMNAKIVDENENVVEPEVTGEIVVERKNTIGLFKGYKDDLEETKSKLTEKYFHSGDLGYYDADGYFYFVGRNDDLINSAGYRIGPFEVENVLMEHPAVAEVAVISSPDAERGEVVKAFILLSKNAKPSDKLVKELQEHCKRITAPYKYPRKIEFVKDFPKTHSGKIKKFELKQKEWKNA